jgi:hypothetical protein
MSETSNVSAKGIVATFDSTALGRVTNIALEEGSVDLDDTDMSHARENHQAGITTVSGSIDCLGDEQAIKDEIGSLVLSGTASKDYGTCICLSVGLGAAVKGQRTSRYTFASAAEGT